jgi:hypothetical protein
VSETARLRAALAPLGRMGAWIGYSQAAQAMGYGPPHSIARLTSVLEALMEEDAAARLPFLAAVVVSPRRGLIPAPGFFQTAARLGRPQALTDPAGFLAAERVALMSHSTG